MKYLLILLFSYGAANAQTQVYNNKHFKCLGNLPSENLNEINALTFDTYPDVLKQLNDTIKNRFYGYKQVRKIKDDVVIFSRISNNFLIYEIFNGYIKTIQIDDSIFYNKVNTEDYNNQLSIVKRKFYKIEVGEELDEFNIGDFCYFEGKLYLYAAVIDYTQMLSKSELINVDNLITIKNRYYLLEIEIKSENKFEITSKIELDRLNKNYEFSHFIWTINNTPTFLYSKEKGKEEFNWYINLKTKEWNNFIEFKRKDRLFVPFTGNTIFNQYCFNRGSNILIDNTNNVAMKFSIFGYDTVMYYDLFSVDSIAYLVLKDLLFQKLLIYKIDTKNKTSEVIKTYDHMSKTNRYFFSWYDPNKKIITVYGIKDPFTIYTLGTIEHGK